MVYFLSGAPILPRCRELRAAEKLRKVQLGSLIEALLGFCGFDSTLLRKRLARSPGVDDAARRTMATGVYLIENPHEGEHAKTPDGRACAELPKRGTI